MTNGPASATSSAPVSGDTVSARASGKGAWYVQLGVTVVVGLIVLIAYLNSVHDGEIALGFGSIAMTVAPRLVKHSAYLPK